MQHEVSMAVDKVTKGAVRYAPTDESEIGSVYVRKTMLPTPPPELIKVQVSWES